jgi:hypothetical protein
MASAYQGIWRPTLRRYDTAIVTSSEWVSLVGQVVWPVTVLALGLALRRQIGDFLTAIAGRITRVSVLSISLDLAVATEASPHWQSRGGGADVRGLVVAQDVTDSYFDSLRKSLVVPGSADFIVVDLKSDGGHEWLTSRLYLFTYLLGRLKGVRAVVFVATRGDTNRSFLGVAHAEDLLRVLVQQDPRLRLARLQAEAERVGRLESDGPLAQEPDRLAPGTDVVVPEDVDRWWSEVAAGINSVDPLLVAQRFLTRMQWEPPPPMADDVPAGWLALPSAPGRNDTWEHASWIRAPDLTDGFLGPIVRPDDCIVDDRGWSSADRMRAVAAATGDFVALLSASRRFERLVDRPALLVTLGEKSVEALPKA